MRCPDAEASAQRLRSGLALHWGLDEGVTFLNHGSFGATPRVVLEHQSALRAEMEREPVRFMVERLEPLLDEARRRLAGFLGCDAEGLAFVPNATHAVNAVLRSLRFEPGDELLTTSHAYNACRCALEVAAERSGARVVVAEVPFPIDDPGRATEAVLGRVTARTRLALLDHVTSPTALVLPIAEMVRALESRGVLTLVDGAHAPGMVDLDIAGLGAAAYTGNCHKWICAPKGAGFLWVRADLSERVHPVATSHGHNSARTDRSRYHLEFDWTGTDDPTAYLCVPAAIDAMGSLHPDGWDGIRRANRSLALRGRSAICEALGIDAPAPEGMIGSIASIPLPAAPGSQRPGAVYPHALQERLIERWRIQVPIVPFPAWPSRLVRISAQLYNGISEYERLAGALKDELDGERGRAGGAEPEEGSDA
ncbi:MAG: aminotransferase class V-fold PLP-dependent enzyme [Phycisphaerales bacterium]